MTIKDLEPKELWSNFDALTKCPRPSKHEEIVREFLVNWAKKNKIDCRVDKVGNIILSKPATKGMENVHPVVLQAHMDMVPQARAGKKHDFLKDPIKTKIVGDWVYADDTTLGADDGIGVAMEMALLESTDIEHGPLECVFTRDEETGLTGAEGMKSDFMTGRLLVNLDSEDEGEIFVSCAGGCRTFAQFAYKEEPLPAGFFTFSLAIKGLTGGHSGDDIDKKRANANKLLARFLYLSQQKYDLRLIDIQAGGLHNAIPREAWCLAAVPMKDKESIAVDWNLFQADVEEEYSVTEKTMTFLLESEETATSAIDKDCSRRLIRALQAVDNGVFAVCQDLDLIETSSNLASIHKTPTSIDVNSSQRSSIHSARVNMANTFAAAFELAGAKVEIGEGYPGWKMNPNSEILRIAVEQYKKLFSKEPVVRGIHAGLECGLFSEKFPGMDMISMGPTLRGVHSPDEKLLIPTVQMVWDHLLAILKNAPTL